MKLRRLVVLAHDVIAAGLAWIDKKLGHAAVVRLFDHAPRAILAGELPD